MMDHLKLNIKFLIILVETFEVFLKNSAPVITVGKSQNDLQSWLDGVSTFIVSFLDALKKICPSFYFKEKWKSHLVYDRAVVAPTDPVEPGIRSNVVPIL